MRSLNTGFDAMSALVRDFDFDVFGVSETWLHPDTPSGNFSIPGYTLLRMDRKDNVQDLSRNTTGGGVALYVKNGVVYEQYTLTEDVDPGIEYLSIVLKVKGQRLGLCVVYRPPHVRYTSLSVLFCSLFVNLAIEVNTVMYLGDTNIDLLSTTSNDAKYLRRLMKETNTKQVINEPTRVTATSATLLDHIIVDRSAEVMRTGVIDAPSILDHKGAKITDHRMVCCTIRFNKCKKVPKMITYRDFSKFDPTRAATATADIDWEKVTQLQGVNSIEKFITTHIRTVFDNEAPIVRKRVTKDKAPWRNDIIVKYTKLKNKLRNKYWKTRDSVDWKNYKRARNNLNELVWRTKKAFFTEKLSSNKNPKEFWTCLKKCNVVENNRHRSFPLNLNIDDINKYFIGMGGGKEVSAEKIALFNENRREGVVNDFIFSTVTCDEVKSAMNEIKSKAVGSDEISIDMVKAVSPYAIEAITHLINTSLIDGIFPENWKTSLVHPLPKVAAPKCVEQLRPISILPAISKILEKIVTRQFVHYMEKEKVLPTTQSGFRKSHSTCTALVNLFSDLIDERDRGRYSSVVMLDFSQAFDSINHELLMAKMHYYGFAKSVIDWVKTYLDDRSQITKLGAEASAVLFRHRGVPQGSCLGPILFNLYTSDFPTCVQSCGVHLYADDSQLHLSYEPNNTEEAFLTMNSDLESISQWSDDNGLKLNVGKCTVIHLAPRDLVEALSDKGLRITIGGEGLDVCDSVKTLGVVLDRDLTFSDHVTYTIQRAIGRLRGLYRYRDLLPESARLQLMQAFVFSVFYYCYPAYGNSISKGDSERIQKLQNSAIRFVFKLKRSDHLSPYRDAAGLLPMGIVCRIQTCILIHKVLSDRQPQYLSGRLSSREEVSNYRTRHVTHLLHFPKVRLELGRRSFSYFGPKLYNDLPENFKQTKTVSFRLKVKAFYAGIIM